MQLDTAAHMRSAGKSALAPGAMAVAAAAVLAGPVPAHAGATAGKAAPAPAPQPLGAKFRRSNILFGRRVPVTGRLLTGQPGRRVLLQVDRGRGWDNVDRATTGARGRFRLSFRPHGLGRYRMRVRLIGPVAASSAVPVARSAIHTHGKVIVYRSSFASWYGPGFMGGRTACGGTLSASTVGVANKTLPCGTRVRFYYRGRSVAARVVDRGPYVAGREWDLTPALKARLGFPSTGVVWSTR